MGLEQQTGRLPDRSGAKAVSSQLPSRGRFVSRCGKCLAIAARLRHPLNGSGALTGISLTPGEQEETDGSYAGQDWLRHCLAIVRF